MLKKLKEKGICFKNGWGNGYDLYFYSGKFYAVLDSEGTRDSRADEVERESAVKQLKKLADDLSESLNLIKFIFQYLKFTDISE